MTAYAVVRRDGEGALWEGKPKPPGRLDVELTERCNLSCIHCYINRPAGDREARVREMSTERVQAVLRETAALGCFTVRFTGGEPLLREDFAELYRFARRLGLRVLVFTNATLITPEIADLFARVPPLEKIEITVYGMSPESYAAVTGVSTAYRAARRGIALLLERRVPFVVKGALLPPNRHEQQEFEAWAATIPWMRKRPSSLLDLNLRARRDSHSESARIEALRLSPEDGAAIRGRDRARYRADMAEFCGKFIGPPGEKLFSCGAGMGVGSVDAYGRVQTCLLLRHPDTVYDPAAVEETAVSEAGLSAARVRLFPAVRELRAQDPEYLVRCARCFLKGLCDQCPAKSWMEHGTLDTPVSYLCEVAHARARDLGLLAVGERAWEVTDWKSRVARLRAEAAGVHEASDAGGEERDRTWRLG
ncbi:radical SAM protein [Candidatus Binatia bacterium]|nr:radical SAM protein [Candidatus Binatia bacterium]